MRALAPKGGNDNVQTPPELARLIVEHFKPSGVCLDPCSGKGAFRLALAAFPQVIKLYDCEITEGFDFMEWNKPVAWIVTNPPWSKFRDFLQQSMQFADNIVFLSLVNAWFMRARVEDMRKAGFGMVEILYVSTPPKPWPQTGFALGATWIRRGWTGGCHHNYSLYVKQP